MAEYPTITKLPLDVTGTAPGNRRVGERHKISAVNGDGFNFFIPDYAPFFKDGNNILLYDDDEARELKEGIDYYVTHLFTHAVGEVDEHKPVFGSITFINKFFDHNITIDYNALGGDWSLSPNTIYEIMANRMVSPFEERWENIVGKPLKFPVKDHTHDIQTDFTGFETLIAVIEKLIEAIKVDEENPDLAEIYKTFRDLIANSIKGPLTITGETRNKNNPTGHTHKIDRATYTAYGITKFADKASDKDEYIGLAVTSSLLYKYAFFRERKITLADNLNEKYLNRIHGAYAYHGRDRTISLGLTPNANGHHPSLMYNNELYVGTNGSLVVLPYPEGTIQYLMLDNSSIFIRRYMDNADSPWVMITAAGGTNDINGLMELINEVSDDVANINNKIDTINENYDNFVSKQDLTQTNNAVSGVQNSVKTLNSKVTALQAAHIFKDEVVTGQDDIKEIKYLKPEKDKNGKYNFDGSYGYRRYVNTNTAVLGNHPDTTFERNETKKDTISGIIFTYPANNCIHEQIITDSGYVYFRIRSTSDLLNPGDWFLLTWPSYQTINGLRDTVDKLNTRVLNISTNIDETVKFLFESNYDKIVNDIISKVTTPHLNYAHHYEFDVNDYIDAGETPTAEDIAKYKEQHHTGLMTIEIGNELEEIVSRKSVPVKGNLNQTDLNTLTGTFYGEYFQNLNKNATEACHYPKIESSDKKFFSMAGILKVFQNHAFGEKGASQMYIPHNSNQIFTRFYLPPSNYWSQWESIGGNIEIKPSDLEYIYPNGNENAPHVININDEIIIKDPNAGKAVEYIPEVRYLGKDNVNRWVTVGFEITNLEVYGISVNRTSDGAIAIRAGNKCIVASNHQLSFLPDLYTPTSDIINAEFRLAVYVRSLSGMLPSVGGGNDNAASYYLGQFQMFPFRANELPSGWYFRNGDNYLLTSPQGQALNSLSANFKLDHSITIKTIDGKQYINVPTTFNAKGIGFFERPVNGADRQVGSIQGDAIRRITGRISSRVGDPTSAFLGDFVSATGAFAVVSPNTKYGILDDFTFNGDGTLRGAEYLTFDSGNTVPTGDEVRPVNLGLTPAIYLGV